MVHTHLEDEEHSGSEDGLLPEWRGDTKEKGLRYRIARTLGLDNRKGSKRAAVPPYVNGANKGFASTDGAASPAGRRPTIRTLQSYHGGPNEERTEYMEQHSALREKDLAANVEQVSIFLMANNTVVSFFEHSAADVENPILNRLSSEATVLRRSSDASMVVQAIMDAIIDFAIPVAAAYKDALDELELRVLTGKQVFFYHETTKPI